MKLNTELEGDNFIVMRGKLESLISSVYEANIKLKSSGLVIETWGNVSAIDRVEQVVAIKPSGVPYEEMKEDDIVLVDMDGKVIDSCLKPSSDLPTHLYLYKEFSEIGSVIHTHSRYATAFAQAKMPVPVFGTTHADYCYGEILVTYDMPEEYVKDNYELNTGRLIVEYLRSKGMKVEDCPFILVASHGPFVWGRDTKKALENAIVLEEICHLAFLTLELNSGIKPINKYLLDKHFFRKHGINAYYGQT